MNIINGYFNLGLLKLFFDFCNEGLQQNKNIATFFFIKFNINFYERNLKHICKGRQIEYKIQFRSSFFICLVFFMI
jgi:hypothetical protein